MLISCKMVSNMRYLLSDLYVAFNPAVELRSPAWYPDGEGGEAELTKEELIIHGCMIRQRLQHQLSDLNYRILKLNFKQMGDVESAFIDLAAIRPAVIADAKIRSVGDLRFIDLCCLNECWQVDLFRTKEYGPMKRYALSSRPELLSRRRKRISVVVKMMRVQAIRMAENVLMPSCASQKLTG